VRQLDRVTPGAALGGMPRITPEQWRASGVIVRWMIASRAAVLVMTFSSAAVGGVLAVLHGRFDAASWALCTIGLLLAHAANNQLNDYTDSRRGIDTGNYFRTQYGAHVLEDGLLTPVALLRYIAATGGAALAIGVYLLWAVGSAVWWPLLAGAFLLLFYTYPLKKLGLGEPAVLLVWGPLMCGGTYLVSTGAWSWGAALVGTVYALAPTAVIFGKHVDKLPFDDARGVRTLPVRLGMERSRVWIVAMTVLQYLSLPVLIVSGVLPWTVLVVLLAVPDAHRLIVTCLRPPPAERPEGYPPSAWPLWYVAFAFAHARSFGLFFITGLLLACLL